MALLDRFVTWLNGVFGLEYAEYDFLWAIITGLVSLVAIYYALRWIFKPLAPLFTNDDIAAENESAASFKGVRELKCDWEPSRTTELSARGSSSHAALRQASAYSIERTSGNSNTQVANSALSDGEPPLVQILPMEDFSQSSPRCAKMAGDLADGLLHTLKRIPNLAVDRATLNNKKCNGWTRKPQFVVSGTVREDDDAVHVSVHLRDAIAGTQIWTKREICSSNELAKIEKDYAVEIGAVVIAQHRDLDDNIKTWRPKPSPVEQSRPKYPNDPRPSIAPQRKTGRLAR